MTPRRDSPPAPAPLPPGQIERDDFPRFGLIPFAKRFPMEPGRAAISIEGAVRNSVMLETELAQLPRVELTADFHCVTTWTRRDVHWSGFRFADFYRQLVLPLAVPDPKATLIVLRGQDGAHTSLPLADLMARDVLLADRLDGAPLPLAHGAPLRLVAPAHYGYKSVKHLHRIEIRHKSMGYRPVGFRFMSHPRGRVAQEERGRWVPDWLLRYLYRPLIGPTAARFQRALRQREQSPPHRGE